MLSGGPHLRQAPLIADPDERFLQRLIGESEGGEKTPYVVANRRDFTNRLGEDGEIRDDGRQLLVLQEGLRRRLGLRGALVGAATVLDGVLQLIAKIFVFEKTQDVWRPMEEYPFNG